MVVSDRQPDSTRDALIRAGIMLFGEQGFDATSTRALAQAAGANIAAIAYHFGGKEGLRLACAEALAAEMAARLDLSAVEPAGDRDTAREQLIAIQRRFIGFLIADERAAAVSRFVLRELSAPSGAFAVLFETLMRPAHTQLCRLWGAATGTDPDSEATRLAVFAALGSTAYFRVARPVVTARMGWDTYSPQAVSAIAHTLETQLRAALDAASPTPQPEPRPWPYPSAT